MLSLRSRELGFWKMFLPTRHCILMFSIRGGGGGGTL